MTTEKRRRRAAPEARERIIEAARKRLIEVGPDRLRLQELAADLGIAHPTILHHFGNRESLVDAVLERSIRRIEEDLLETFRSPDPTDDGVGVLPRVVEAFVERGHARLLAWLILAKPRGSPIGTEPTLDRIARAMHVHGKGDDLDLEKIRFRVILAALVLFGEAVAGPTMRQSGGLGEEGREGVREWMRKEIEGWFARDYLPSDSASRSTGGSSAFGRGSVERRRTNDPSS
jgi:AcrR family transcriptional regulator